jgi:hypothetical protein
MQYLLEGFDHEPLQFETGLCHATRRCGRDVEYSAIIIMKWVGLR